MTLGDWYEVARAANLALANVVADQITGSTFHALRREMTHATVRTPSYLTSPWLHGVRRDVALVARVLTLRQIGAAAPGAPTHTSVIAEIDPPLFAGLRLMSRGLIAYYGAPAKPELTGHAELDARFVATAFDLMRVQEIVLPGAAPDRLGEAIVQATRSCDLIVKDSYVEAIALGASPSHDRIELLIDIATALAREISARTRNVRPSPLETKGRESWQRLAARLGLAVDPLRWHVFGPLDGVHVSAMLDGSPPAVSMTFRARFRKRLPGGLLLRRDFRAKGDSGFPDLDRLFALRAHDLEAARALFADGDLRLMLANEVQTSNLVLDEHEVVTGYGGFASSKEIAQRLASLVAIVDRMTPAPRLPTGGPFR